MNRIFPAVFFFCLCCAELKAQKPLPDFSVVDLNKTKARISWINKYGDSLIQLNVQVSFDSLKFYKTIFSTESPELPQNGFVYTLPYPTNFYYRIFYVLLGDKFYFSAARHAVPDTSSATPSYGELPNDNNTSPGTGNKPVSNPAAINNEPPPVRMITVRNRDSVFAVMEYSYYKHFKDSINKSTKDTLFVLGKDEVQLRPFNPDNIYVPSVYVIANKDGFIQLKLPEAGQKKYKISFFEMDGKKLFTINNIPESDLVIDKANFIHAGWFRFELYENEKLKERNKVLLQRDF
ncbi:MAG TPA: hypothetical protein PKM63_06300 [Panacibacter sp.]|nr:hypothetical protein [Panacibacter sp.]HNP43878.1 hypothetical protein [Panacibacter sp.]